MRIASKEDIEDLCKFVNNLPDMTREEGHFEPLLAHYQLTEDILQESISTALKQLFENFHKQGLLRDIAPNSTVMQLLVAMIGGHTLRTFCYGAEYSQRFCFPNMLESINAELDNLNDEDEINKWLGGERG